MTQKSSHSREHNRSQLGPQKQLMTASIIEAFEPFTMSCAMVVRLHGHPDHQQGLGKPMVLKVYSRRFTKKPREHHQILLWRKELEEQHHQLIHKDSSGIYLPFPLTGRFL